MKKLIFTCLLFVFIANVGKAQYVTIPDANFRNELKALYPTCFNGNDKMDTTCLNIVNEDSLSIPQKGMKFLNGIQYFKNLKFLNCTGNEIRNIPSLPSTLITLDCSINKLDSLPSLPSSLLYLNCGSNSISSLPSLPSSLIELNCGLNQISSLPNLPNSITLLDFGANYLNNNMPSLPNSLTILRCWSNTLFSLPNLPNSLKELNCQNIQLRSFPDLPDSLTYLNCSFNQISGLKPLPISLTYLDCSYNQLTSLPNLPSLLVFFDCGNNLITTLPSLPSSLTKLRCYQNQLNSLPELPNSLKDLICIDKQISSLPNLPNSLLTLNCGVNQLSSLPILPNSIININCTENQLVILPSLPYLLKILNCDYNQLTNLPSLPNSLGTLTCSYNPLNCLPLLPNGLGACVISKTNIKCIPNQPVNIYIDVPLPICTDPSDICQVQSFAKGFVYNDANSNGVFDSLTESVISDQIISVSPNDWKGISDINGNYLVKLDTSINNTWSCNTTKKYATTVPDSYSATPTSLDLLPNDYNFGLRFKPNIKDLEATLAGTVARPGFTTNMGITANNIGTINQSNITLKLKKPAGYDVLATSTAPTSILDDTLFWENVSIDFLDKKSFYVELQVPVNEELGTEIVYETWVNGTEGDTTPIDNYNKWIEIVRGSFDPNDKLVSKTNLPPAYDVEKDRLIYTIRFQNTGTDTAFYVRVKDEIPTNLNISTLKVLNTSHAYQLIVRDKNIVEFAFPNILLPDSGTNEPKSHGYVQFSIQPKAGLPINTKIENNASIYFDYNAPIITNFATTEVKLTTGLASNKNLDFKLFPNPTNGTVRIELPYGGDGNWLLSDISGRQIKTDNIANGEKIMELNLSDLPSGTYFITIQLGNNVSTAKIIKM